MSSNKKGKTSKILALIMCIVLSLAAVAGAGTALYMGARNNGWFDKTIIEEDDSVTDETTESAGDMYVSEGTSNGITLTAAKLTADEYEEYGISTASVESAYTVTATCNSTASNPKYSWYVGNGGDDTSVRITLTPSSDTKSCVVTCVSAFSQYRILYCTSADVSGNYIEATCNIYYYMRASGATFEVYDDSDDTDFPSIIWNSANSTVTWSPSSFEATSYDSNTSTTYGVVFGTGTTSQTYSASVSLKSNVTSSTISTSFMNYRAFLANITGVSSSLSDSSFTSSVYNKLISYYNSSTPAAVFTVKLTGGQAGDTSTYTFSLIINPSYLT